MNKSNIKIGVLSTILLVLLSSSACSISRRYIRVGSLQTESRSIALDDTESIRVDIEMGAGELQVNGGAADLLQADFAYNVAELKPEVVYSGGTLGVLTPEVEGVASLWDIDDYRNEWGLRFNNDVAMEMKIELGAGQADLQLGDLSLTRLDLDTGAGEVRLDLNNVSDLTRLIVDMGAGKVTVDLTGDWKNDLDADISGGVGEMTLLLPREACVRVDVEGGLSNINTTGLTKDGSDYVNEACGESDVTLHIDVQAGIGNINLEQGD